MSNNDKIYIWSEGIKTAYVGSNGVYTVSITPVPFPTIVMMVGIFANASISEYVMTKAQPLGSNTSNVSFLCVGTERTIGNANIDAYIFRFKMLSP